MKIWDSNRLYLAEIMDTAKDRILCIIINL
jgi:hypothetical protein